MKKEKILVWLSGGVDSAVSAALLLEQGYEVVGGFMKNYVSDTGNCTTYKDAEEAIKVAKHLGIELLSFDLQKEYQEKIIDYIFEGYKKGITPNPDVLCNSLIKFDVFLRKALESWFDKIATGHYARICHSEGMQWPKNLCKTTIPLNQNKEIFSDKDSSSLRSSEWHYELLRWEDPNKDQSYFLAGLNQFQLSKSLFPLWGLSKPEVRALAKKFELPNADRKDSQGLCFIGNVPIREFLLQRFEKKEGDILYVDSFASPPARGYVTKWQGGYGKKVWTHQGAYFYTIGQKHGLGLNFKAYVYRIDIENNLLYVTDKDGDELKSKQLVAKDWHWIIPEDEEKYLWKKLNGKIRYRQNPPVACKLEPTGEKEMLVTFEEEQRAIAPGQIFVAYDGEVCLWCGTIE